MEIERNEKTEVRVTNGWAMLLIPLVTSSGWTYYVKRTLPKCC